MLPIWEADFRLETLIFFHHLTVTSIHHIQVANYQIFTKVTSQGPTDIEKSTSQMMFRLILQQQKEHPTKRWREVPKDEGYTRENWYRCHKWPYFKGVHLFRSIILGYPKCFRGCIPKVISRNINIQVRPCAGLAGPPQLPTLLALLVLGV